MKPPLIDLFAQVLSSSKVPPTHYEVVLDEVCPECGKPAGYYCQKGKC